MDETQTKQPAKLFIQRAFFALLAIAIIVYVLVSVLVNARLEQLELQTRLYIEEQRATLATIAETTARNGADAVTEQIIRDCSLDERSRFNSLLGRLDQGLARSELTDLERLFGRCGSFFSERKSVMVSRLTRELEYYETYISQLEIIVDEPLAEEFQLEEWRKMVAEEQSQSELFSELVSLQGQIITELLAGRGPNSDEIRTILLKVQETQDALLFANTKAREYRTQLTNL